MGFISKLFGIESKEEQIKTARRRGYNYAKEEKTKTARRRGYNYAKHEHEAKPTQETIDDLFILSDGNDLDDDRGRAFDRGIRNYLVEQGLVPSDRYY